RVECARLVRQVDAKMRTGYSNATARELLGALEQEFAPEIQVAAFAELRVEDAYVRAGGIGGQPLADDYHFAKTVVDDFGRPFGNGGNAVAGVSIRSSLGPVAAYVQGEYQHAGTLAAQSPAELQAIATQDEAPFAVPRRTGSLDRFRFLDSYGSINFHNNVISFGKQTLWWGPGGDAPFLFSNNAEPLPMLRISRATPFKLPWLFRLMGPIRFELMWGRLEGQQFVSLIDAAGTRSVVGPVLNPHPFVDGEKFSFKPTQNLEFGFGVTTVFSGPGFPFTLKQILRTYKLSNTIPGEAGDPGDRRSAFDFSYRLPGLRNWATLYTDSFTEDEFSPISFPRKSSFRAGIYMPQLPKLPRADFRVEGIYTDIPSLRGTGVAYFNTHYLSGYTNFGQIIGSWIGREGSGVSAWGTYHFSPQNAVQLRFRDQHVNPSFLGGGHMRDYSVNGTLAKIGGLVLSGNLQYEHWAFPVVAAGAKSNVMANIEVEFRPTGGWLLWSKK
ncbi:MAG TPA: capsule assembly Wzi family protein, partial [Candidatus Acidoferrum sp.]|nr:capsule assembly Wzi family protein [Candidatus Acidoferrum sp.]